LLGEVDHAMPPLFNSRSTARASSGLWRYNNKVVVVQ